MHVTEENSFARSSSAAVLLTEATPSPSPSASLSISFLTLFFTMSRKISLHPLSLSHASVSGQTEEEFFLRLTPRKRPSAPSRAKSLRILSLSLTQECARKQTKEEFFRRLILRRHRSPSLLLLFCLLTSPSYAIHLSRSLLFSLSRTGESYWKKISSVIPEGYNLYCPIMNKRLR